MSKIFAIAWKDVLITFTDRNLILIMLVTPLTLSTIIAVALGDVASGANFRDIPVAIVNMDAGDPAGEVNYGQIYVSAFIPQETSTSDAECSVSVDDGEAGTDLADLTNATIYDNAETARQAVRDGDVVAAVIIPEDLSRTLAFQPGQEMRDPVNIEVFGDPNRSISAAIIRSVVEGLTNQIVTGQIAIAATVDTLIASGNALNFEQDALACAFVPGFNTITVAREAVAGDEFDPLVIIGSAQAAFFALFTAAGGASGILEERQNGTMQRMLVSPTSRLYILLGKLIGVFMMVLLQLVFLFVSFTLVGSMLDGEIKLIWGTNIPAIIALILLTSLSAAGVGIFIASLAKTVEQVGIVGGVVALAMGMLGGAFFQVEVLGDFEFVTRLSIVRWGAEGFTKLSNGEVDIGLNLLFLLLIGMVLFATSLAVFARREDM